MGEIDGLFVVVQRPFAHGGADVRLAAVLDHQTDFALERVDCGAVAF